MRTMKRVLLGVALAALAAGWAAAAAGPDCLTVIFNRKSVRQYAPQPVPRAALETLVRAGMAAPTAADKRPWAFVVITERAKLDALAQGMPFGRMLAQAGAAIAVCGIPEKSLPGAAQAFWVQDCSAATENILLAVEAQGLGAVWLGVYPDEQRQDFVRRTLGLPSNVVPLNVVSIGVPAGETKPKDKYDPANVHWEQW